MRRLATLACSLLIVTSLGTGSARSDDITLILSAPEPCACGWVRVNGYVHDSDGQLWDLVWDWGDGTRSISWFPASHRYAVDGIYEITVSAVGCTSEVETTVAVVAGAEGSGCPTDSAPPCHAAAPCRYLYPYNMHLVDDATSSVPLHLRDAAGAPAPEPLSFDPGDATLASIAEDGLVTALRSEGPAEIGAWASATLTTEGRPAANTSVIRVLPQDYAVPFAEAIAGKAVLYYPMVVKGENLGTLVAQHEIPAVNGYAHAIQGNLLAIEPNNGCRQVFEVDFGVTEEGRVCGISGNPIRLGWNIEGNAWQNCFLVPFQQPRSPQWFVFHHELGHNFSWSSSLFARMLGTFVYSEGMASTLALADMRRILDNPLHYPLGTTARSSLALVCDSDSQRFRDDFGAWLAAGADFGLLDPNIVDGLWLHHAGSDVFGFAARFFAPLEPVRVESLGPVLCGIEDDADRHTVFAALVSAAAGEDLSATFRDSYHYPLDQALFDTSYEALADILGQTGAGRVPDGSSWPARPLTVERAAGGQVTLRWAPSCRAGDTDYAVYEGSLGAFYEQIPMTCSTAGATEFTGLAAEGSTYYLIAPLHGGWEGSLGTDSRGAERPPGPASCLPQRLASCP